MTAPFYSAIFLLLLHANCEIQTILDARMHPWRLTDLAFPLQDVCKLSERKFVTVLFHYNIGCSTPKGLTVLQDDYCSKAKETSIFYESKFCLEKLFRHLQICLGCLASENLLQIITKLFFFLQGHKNFAVHRKTAFSWAHEFRAYL